MFMSAIVIHYRKLPSGHAAVRGALILAEGCRKTE